MPSVLTLSSAALGSDWLGLGVLKELAGRYRKESNGGGVTFRVSFEWRRNILGKETSHPWLQKIE